MYGLGFRVWGLGFDEFRVWGPGGVVGLVQVKEYLALKKPRPLRTLQ